MPITSSNIAGLEKLFGTSKSESGERVSVDTVFGLPAFREGVRQVSTAIGKTDCWCYQQSIKNGRSIDNKHATHRLLSHKANEWQTSFMWRSTLVANAMWDGNGYSVISRGDNFEPTGLINLDSRDVYQFWLHDGFNILETWYSVSSNGKEILVPAADMIHVRNLALHTGQEGLGIIDTCKMVLGKAISQHRMASTIFKEGIHSTLYLTVPNWLTEDQKKDLKEAMDQRKGAGNAGKIITLFGGATIGSLPSSAEDMQLVEAIHASLNDVALIVGVPVSMLGGATSSVYGSVQQDALSYLQNTLDAWMTNIETELSAKLLADPDSHFIEFDRTSMFANNPDYRKTIIEEWKNKAITWEEMRTRLNESTSEPEPVEPEPMVIAAPEPQAAPEQAPEQAPEAESPADTRSEPENPKAMGLLTATLERLKRRIVKAIEGGNIDLSSHYEVIKESLPDFNIEEIINQLDNMQPELNQVLPEQRLGVFDRWNLETIYSQLV